MSVKIYPDNGLPFWTHEDIIARDSIVRVLENAVAKTLLKENRGWLFERIEAPVIIPSGFISDEYDTEDYYQLATDPGTYLSLRPETTRASYEYMRYQFEHQTVNPPYCVYQLAKSFRNENDQVTKNMRFKEFYQLEFQCVYTAETKNDYHSAALEPLAKAVAALTHREVRVVPSDRLPSYSASTMDIEIDMGYKWLEVCSISARTDVPFGWNGKTLKNVEIAFGADRLVEVVNG